jgi:hypothetical protein
MTPPPWISRGALLPSYPLTLLPSYPLTLLPSYPLTLLPYSCLIASIGLSRAALRAG